MEYKIGQKEKFSKTITEFDVYSFAGITGDFNQVHINEEYAKDTYFKTRIVHGMLIASFISTVLGTKMPGEGTIYMGQEIKFLRPVYLNDTITVEVEIIEMGEKNSAVLDTKVYNQERALVVDGTAKVKLPYQG